MIQYKERERLGIGKITVRKTNNDTVWFEIEKVKPKVKELIEDDEFYVEPTPTEVTAKEVMQVLMNHLDETYSASTRIKHPTHKVYHFSDEGDKWTFIIE